MAPALTQILPDIQVLLNLEPSELGAVVLRLARDSRQNGMVHMQYITGQIDGNTSIGIQGYPQHRRGDVERAISAAWSWLEREGLLIPAPPPNGPHGWRIVSKEAEALHSDSDFESFRLAAAFPQYLLHPSVAESVHREIMRGEYDNAVLKAFRAVEESVRSAAPGAPKTYGKSLMTYAFGVSGPLRDPDENSDEADGLMQLFVGAISWAKNPQSHRTVNIDGNTARELAIFASLLLRIVDERRVANRKGSS